MNNNELVSVIITTFKREPIMVERAIKSVVNQTYKSLELIIVDDSPYDYKQRASIASMVESFDDNRIKYIQHKENKGACEARNTGIKNSNGAYVAFLDDDDEWKLNKLELQLDKFANGVGLVYCDSYTITLKNNQQINKTIRENRISGLVYRELLGKNFIGSTSFVIIKREALIQCGYFNKEFKSAQDYDLWLRVSKKYKVEYVDLPLVNYYIHEGERISENVANRIQGLEKIIEVNKNYLEKNPKLYSEKKLLIVPFYAVKYGFKYSFRKWWEAVKIYPYHRPVMRSLVKIAIYKMRYNKKIRG